jgi:zinc protease
MQLYHLGKDYFDTRNDKVRAVTLEGVRAMAKRLIDPDHLLLVTVGKEKTK